MGAPAERQGVAGCKRSLRRNLWRPLTLMLCAAVQLHMSSGQVRREPMLSLLQPLGAARPRGQLSPCILAGAVR